MKEMCNLKTLGVSDVRALAYYDRRHIVQLCKLLRSEIQITELEISEVLGAVALGRELGMLRVDSDLSVHVDAAGIGSGSYTEWREILSSYYDFLDSNLTNAEKMWVYTLLTEKVAFGNWSLRDCL